MRSIATHGMAALISLMSGLIGLWCTARRALRACPDLASEETAFVNPGSLSLWWETCDVETKI